MLVQRSASFRVLTILVSGDDNLTVGGCMCCFFFLFSLKKLQTVARSVPRKDTRRGFVVQCNPAKVRWALSWIIATQLLLMSNGLDQGGHSLYTPLSSRCGVKLIFPKSCEPVKLQISR